MKAINKAGDNVAATCSPVGIDARGLLPPGSLKVVASLNLIPNNTALSAMLVAVPSLRCIVYCRS
jgi:hypothetical protein